MEVLTIVPFGGGGGGGDASVAGSDTQIQYNDGGSLGASADLTWDDTAKELGVGGDINLDDGGTYSTTLQMVTATANRTISFPDATGTVALVSGSNGTVQYNEGGVLKGNSDFTVDPDWNDASTVFTGLKLNVTDTASAVGARPGIARLLPAPPERAGAQAYELVHGEPDAVALSAGSRAGARGGGGLAGPVFEPGGGAEDRRAERDRCGAGDPRRRRMVSGPGVPGADDGLRPS